VVLAGTLTVPATVTPPPVVLLLGGSGPQDRDGARVELPGYRPFRDLTRALSSAGIAVLRLDDRGTAASSGRFAGATTLDFASDAAAAVRWLRGRRDIDGARPALLGHSEGALVALIVAAGDSALSALVLLGAPSRPGRELARWQRLALVQGDGMTYPTLEREAVLADADARAERVAAADPWMREWFALDPRTYATRTRTPVLLLHGENDRQVPVGQSEELAAVLRARPSGAHGGTPPAVVLQRFAATDHLFLEDFDGDPRSYVRLADRAVRTDVCDVIRAWLQSQFRTSAVTSTRGRSVRPREKTVAPRENLVLPREKGAFSEGKTQ
jgi:fermentation-respiration switch protein FrsA (DUF1100 family)